MHGVLILLLGAAAFLPQASKKGVVLEKPSARVYLKSGSSFEGKILSENDQTIRLSVSFGEILLKKEEVSQIHRGETLAIVEEKPAPIDIPKEEAPAKVQMGFKLPPLLPAEEKASRSAGAAPAHPAAAKPALSSDRRIEGLVGHYLWFFPEVGNAKYLMGAGLFLGFLLVFFLACRMAGIEDLSLGKALAFCGIFFVALSIQVHLDPSDLSMTILFGLVDLVLWFALVKTILREPLYRGGGVLALFVFAALLGALGSELGFVLTHQA